LELARLERAAGMVANAHELTGLVALRLRQVQRRAPLLGELIEAGQRQVTALADALDEAHALIDAVLTEKHEVRSERHWKAVEHGAKEQVG
jgi:hypothetical protein